MLVIRGHLEIIRMMVRVRSTTHEEQGDAGGGYRRAAVARIREAAAARKLRTVGVIGLHECVKMVMPAHVGAQFCMQNH